MNTENIVPEDTYPFYVEDTETAESIISGLIDMAENAYGIVSLVNASIGYEAKPVIERKNFSFLSTESGYFEYPQDLPDFLDIDEFSGYLSRSLRPEQGMSSILALAVFDFKDVDIPAGGTPSSTPREVFQWIVRNGTIVPDDYCETEWSGVKVQPGPEFVMDEPDEYLGYAGSDDEFELPDTSMVAEFMKSLVEKAPDGNHVITVVLSDIVEGYNTSELTFHKAGDTVVIDQTRGGMIIIDISTTIATGEHAGITLRSYLNREHDDGFEAHEDSQEVRSWHLSWDSVRPLSADECRETYCIDEETGDATSPESYVAYREAWS